MDAVSINLTSMGQTFRLPRDFIRGSLPQSVFASALEFDPTATTIDIDNPIVTPNVMQFLVDYSQGIEPPEHIPELTAAERYLNIPWMIYYTVPNYDSIVNRDNPNALVNREAVDNIISDDDVTTYTYLLTKNYDPPASDLQNAVYYDANDIIKLIVKSKYFTPEPYRNDLVDSIYQSVKGNLESSLGVRPGALTDNVEGDMNYTQTLLQAALLLSQGQYKRVYDMMLDSAYELPDDVDACLRIMFERPSDDPEKYKVNWEEALQTRWAPKLPEEPANVFGNW